jgi:hypothetical protein
MEMAHLAELAEALVQRAVRDVQAGGPFSREAWAWLMMPEDAAEPRAGWAIEDVCAVLGIEAYVIRRALVLRGFGFPPRRPSAVRSQRGMRAREGRPKVAGMIRCRMCGMPVRTADVYTTRTCAACGDRLLPHYLQRHGFLSRGYQATKGARLTHAMAAVRALLAGGPLPACYVHAQLGRVGFSAWTIQNAREGVRPRILRSPDGFTLWALEAQSTSTGRDAMH